METIEICQTLYDLLLTIQRAKNLVDEGKEVLCSNKLQGALVKCRKLYGSVSDGLPKNTKLDDQTGEVEA